MCILISAPCKTRPQYSLIRLDRPRRYLIVIQISKSGRDGMWGLGSVTIRQGREGRGHCATSVWS
ncbi:hypothetical protein AGR1C_Lc20187 [Agrobacterium fabacearum TT111]|nr:hypothetical protein AGR1C_Lc20187 [Agrobacterium fabacearum TT111]